MGVDTLVDWVYDMREQCQNGRRVFVTEEQTTGMRFLIILFVH